MATTLSRRKILIPLAIVLVVVVAVGLYLFQPWRVFTNTTVNEQLAPAPSGAAAPALLGSGAFRSLAHETTGRAELVKLADGGLAVQLRDLSTSDGPDLRVWLSTKASTSANDDFAKDGYLELSTLKGNKGNQSYQVPAGTDVSGYQSVLVWCKRFSTGFGVAGLRG